LHASNSLIISKWNIFHSLEDIYDDYIVPTDVLNQG